MITAKDIREAKRDLLHIWGDQGIKVIMECGKAPSLNMTYDEFYTHCISISKYWDPKIILSGIKDLRPEVYALIPKDLGVQPYLTLGAILVLCGVNG